jgi:hypothetical protein
MSARPNHTTASSAPVASTVRTTPWVPNTLLAEKVSNATAIGVDAPAMISAVRWVMPNTSGTSTLMSPNIASPYISEASQRRSMMTRASMRSNAVSMTAASGPKLKRTWSRKREGRPPRRLPGFTSKNSPGTVITFSWSAARKNPMPVFNGGGSAATEPQP